MYEFAAIKDALCISDVAQDYGIQVINARSAMCPFHDDNTPSMSFYKNGTRFHCHGCGASGDTIDLVSRLENIELREAAQCLNHNYHLNINFDTPLPSKMQNHMNLQAQRRKIETWENEAFRILISFKRQLNKWYSIYFPVDADLPLPPLFVEVLHNRDYVDYLIDRLVVGARDYQSKQIFYKSTNQFIMRAKATLEKEMAPYADGAADNTVKAGNNHYPQFTSTQLAM